MDIYNLAGTILGNYEIERLLGRGGMGVVYKARQSSLNRIVALKILPPLFDSDSTYIKRFKQEAHSAARLNHHNIAHIYDIGEEDGVHFFSMEYVEGQTLEQLIEEKGSLESERAIEIVKQAAEALQFAHENDVIHRDIKPSNIMIDGKGGVKLMDFGLAKLAGGPKITDSETIIGTVDYMSPEQANGETVDLRTDIWSLGAVFYEMLAGSAPFDADSAPALMYKIIYEDPRDISSVNPDIPPELIPIVQRMLEKDRGDRYETIRDFLRELSDLEHVSEEEQKKTPAGRFRQGTAARKTRGKRLADPAQFRVGCSITVALCLTLFVGIGVFRSTIIGRFRESGRAIPAVAVDSGPLSTTEAPSRTETAGEQLSISTNEKVLALIADYEAAIAADPDSEGAPSRHMALGNLYQYQLKEYEPAIEHYSALIEKYPNYQNTPQAYIEMANCYERTSDKQKAREVYEEMLENLDPSSRYAAYARKMLEEMKQNPAR